MEANKKLGRLSPTMRGLIEDNRALQATVTELEEITGEYAALVEAYDRELNATTKKLAEVTNALKDAMSTKVYVSVK